MIRIKVISIREIIVKTILLIGIIIVLYFSVKLSFHMLDKLDIESDKQIIDNTLLVRNDYGKSKEDIDIIRNELRIFKSVDIDTLGEQEEALVENEVISNEEIPIVNNQVSHEYQIKKLAENKYRVGSVTINSYIKQNIDVEEFAKPYNILTAKPCRVLIYHTHTSESYTIGENNYSDYYRSEDNKYNVVAVGKALSKYLTNYGFEVVQDITKHDYPSYNGAYKSSLTTVEKHLKTEKYDIILDIHRDALSGNAKFRPTAEINGETAAKIMIVVGTNDAGLEHDNWMQNFKFAIALQEKGNEMYPGLFREMHLSTSRYNQHTSDKSLIIEVGATGNTMEETDISMKYLANVINELVNES